MKHFLKPIIYGLSALIYLDIFLNPAKGFCFLKMNAAVVSLLAFAAFLSLVFLVAVCIFKKLDTRKFAAVLFLITALILINEFLFSTSFFQPVEYVIAFWFVLPVPLVLNELFAVRNIRSMNYISIGALILLLSTIVYFGFFYTPYEDYFHGFPIVFVHQWIRNWLVFISVTVLISVILKKYDQPDRSGNAQADQI